MMFLMMLVSCYAQTIKPLKVKKGALIFSDNFERQDIGENWIIREKFDGAFAIQKGVLEVKELPNAGHGSVARAEFNFSDVVIEFDMQFNGGKRFNLVMDDRYCKSVHAGHISRVSFSKKGFLVQDDKTGGMNLKIRNQIKKNPRKKAELKNFLDAKKSFIKMNFKENKWYHVKIIKKRDVLECVIDGKIAQIKSPGISHSTLNRFGPTVIGDQFLFDNFKVWEIKK